MENNPTKENAESVEVNIKISDVLKLPPVLDRIRNAEDPESGRKILGVVIEYLCLHNSTAGLNDFLENLPNLSSEFSAKDYDVLLVSSVLKKLGLKEPLAKDDAKVAARYLTERLIIQGFYFHSFNGVNEQSITEQGLLPNPETIDQDEMEEIAAIGRKHGVSMILGWKKINSTGKIFFDGHAMNVGKYAYGSPEWFAQFCSEGMHIPNESNRKTAFSRRDYKTAKANITDFCSSLKSASIDDVTTGKAYPNITDDEEQKIHNFFEKYWARYASEDAVPKVALVPKSSVIDVEEKASRYDYDTIQQILLEHSDSVLDATRILEFICNSLRRETDVSVDFAISPENIKIVTLPTHNQTYEEVTDS